MRGESSAVVGSSASLEVRYTVKPVRGWGRLVAVARYLEKVGIRQLLERALPDGRTSPNQIPVVEMVLSLPWRPAARRVPIQPVSPNPGPHAADDALARTWR